MNLFQLGDFTLRSGQRSRWKIECDALTLSDWDALAVMLAERIPPFRAVEGVPRGGIPLADALRKYVTKGGHVLIAEDVVTTGGSITRYAESIGLDPKEIIGCCVFARGKCPTWVTPLFQMPNAIVGVVQ